MEALAIETLATSQTPPNPCWIIRNPLESCSLRMKEGLLVFSTYEGAIRHAQQENLDTYSADYWLWNDLVRKAQPTYSSAVIDFSANTPLVILPLIEVAGLPSTPKKEVKVWPAGTPLLAEIGTVTVPGYDLFKILDCFPIVRKPRSQWLAVDPDEIQNHKWQGVSGKAFGRFHYQAWGTFRAQFMQEKGKIEKNIPPATLHIHELTQEALLKKMTTTLGDRAETKMGQIIDLVSRQPNGEPGVLDTEGQNIFFVRNGPEAELCVGELAAVRLYWDSYHGKPHRWCFDEFIITNICEWDPGAKVFST